MILLPLLVSLALQEPLITRSPESARITLPRVSGRPVLDGRVDEALWQDAAQLTDFAQFEPVDNLAGSQRSVAYVAYDDDYLYFAFRAYESRPGHVRATVFPRERGGEGDDKVTLVLDTFLDTRRAYEFTANPRGIQTDAVKVEGQLGDVSPDFVWYSAGAVEADGWAVEMMIPWASLRFPTRDSLAMGLNVVRVYGRSGQKDSWYPRRRGNPCDICQQGVISGITGISRRRVVDVLPYVSGSQIGARAFATDSAAADGEFFDTRPPLGFSRSRPKGTGGADVRLPLTPAVVLNATVNPDFSQVESDDDQIRVNQRFTLFQQERRPFFLEGRDAFEIPRSDEEQRFNIGDLFYSRAVVDPAGGARITSKNAGVTLATLYARDDQPGYFHYDGIERSGYVPLPDATANVVIARARADVLADSYIGGALLGRRTGDAENGVAAGDFSLRRGGFTLAAEGGLSFDRAPNQPQVSPHLDGRSRNGLYYRARLGRAGHNFYFATLATGVDSSFRDQLGRFSRVGIQQYVTRLGLTQYPSNRLLQRTEQFVTVHTASRFGGAMIDYTVTPRLGFLFYGQTAIDITPLWQLLTVFGTRLYMNGIVLEARSDASQRIAGSGFLYIGDREIIDPANPRVGKGYNASVRLVLRPVPQASLEARGVRSYHSDTWNSPLVDDARIIRIKATYQFTRQLGVRIIEEYSNQYDTKLANPFYRRGVRNVLSGLVSYELGPSSFFYVGYNDGQEDFEQPVVSSARRLRTDNQLFLKLSYLLRI